MTERHNAKDQRRNASKEHSGHMPEPLSGSHKTKQKNHVSQTNGEG
ncbi:small acid-soluble spore protein P [Bacillus sp. FSL W7-1360]